MNKILPLTIAIGMIIFSSGLSGQSSSSYEEKAFAAFGSLDHPATLASYQALPEPDSQRVDAMFRCGEAARLFRIFDLAETFLGQIPDAFKKGTYSETDYNLARVKKGLGKYSEAIVYYRKYIETHPDTSDLLVKRAKEEFDYCKWAEEMIMNPARIEINQMGNNINTVNSDFAPLRYADKLYFTSMLTDPKSGPVLRIFSAINDNPAILLAENASEEGLHSSNISLTVDARRMYYTICSSKALAGDFQCDVYFRDKNYEGFWGNAKKLPKYINLEGYSSTQPSVGFDKIINKEVLFFASDRPGGKGKMDIWCSVVEKDGTFGQPFPLPFNTPQNDITPFFHAASKTLFFSSEGMLNLGGFDIFRTEKTGPDTWTVPENLGYPLNTNYDDVYYTFHSGLKRGYFSSNRPGALCADHLQGCKSNDIYEAKISVDINAWAYNAADGSELSGVKVEMLNLSSRQVDTVQVNQEGNKFSFPLELEKTYRITASHENYQPATVDVNTLGINYFTSLEQKLYLRSGVELVIRTFNAIDNTPLYGAAITLNEDTAAKEFLQQNGEYNNTSFFSLNYNKTYTVSASKPGFSVANAVVSTVGQNSPDTIYQDLYISPFQGLPLVLYFDNDQPRYVNRADTTTTLTYAQTCRSYLQRKSEFLNGYTKGLSWAEKSKAGAAIQSFFKDSIESNFDKLESYGDVLEGYLKAGHRMEMLIAGYASPLASAEYNKRLTSRRISSVVNYFKKYKNGVFMPYFANGQLVINKDPKGEEYDFKNVSDNSDNRRSSVFSPAASRLRKVKITEIRQLLTNR